MPPIHVSRRRFTAIATGALASTALGGCVESFQLPLFDGRLKARPRGSAPASSAPEGDRPLGLNERRDAMLHVPAGSRDRPLPLLVLLHGATGSGEGVLQRLSSSLAEVPTVVLSPSSRDTTWDAIRGGFGPDVAAIDRALTKVFDTVAIDPGRIAVGGFSDGATYALSLGLINGDLFSRVVAFSPGFVVEGEPHGRPKFFISHGTSDGILPIDQASRAIVPDLKRRGYDVTYKEFAGGHDVPPAIARDALAWIAA